MQLLAGLGPLGLPELAIIAFIVVLVFGVGRLPELGGAVGKGIREFRKATKDDEAAPGVTMQSAAAAEPQVSTAVPAAPPPAAAAPQAAAATPAAAASSYAPPAGPAPAGAAIFCVECGGKNVREAKFCAHCGHAIKVAAS
jgi:sec-independent protein translocase protein TatA